MGSGSEIAIEAADMVLLDSFAAIIEAVRYGRVVYDNLKKTITLLAARRVLLRVLACHYQRHIWPATDSVFLPDDHHLLLHGLRRCYSASI